MKDCDVVVVGAGHAGCEAAHAASTMGMETCLLTLDREKIAQMPCNPAIGGVAKGHLVREIDALGGIMGILADRTGIQFRLLNRSRGGAVQAPRAQSDKALYKKSMAGLLETIPHLHILERHAVQILVKNNSACGIRTSDGEKIQAEAVILTPGTFLNGLIHIGLQSRPGGREGEPPSAALSRSLRQNGLSLFRLKTGTPMRLNRRTIDWSCFEAQAGDKDPVPFSFRTESKLENRIFCFIGYTNARTHAVIMASLDKSPLFSGIITGIGPRYCPSIEDKVVKFPHHSRHQFFLEPEGLETDEIYVNGLSSSLPLETQKAILDSIPGLDRAEILRPAYGIEYDAVLPTQLRPTLESRPLKNLYLAGQINGTSGYEEAAAQGLVAGINVSLKIKGKKPFILGRNEAYIGVLIDDLITKGLEEPYRLFTSRAEHRLHLRIDNADRRLTPYGYSFGLIDENTYRKFRNKKKRTEAVFNELQRIKIKDGSGTSTALKNLLKKPKVCFQDIAGQIQNASGLTEEDIRHIEFETKYEGYVKKQEMEIARINRIDREKIPVNFRYDNIPGFTEEVVQALSKHKPRTIGEAKRIPAITPAAILNLHVHIQKRHKKRRLSKAVSKDISR